MTIPWGVRLVEIYSADLREDGALELWFVASDGSVRSSVFNAGELSGRSFELEETQARPACAPLH